MLNFGYFGELYTWKQDIMMTDQKEFLQVEVNPGGTGKILFICLIAKEIKNNFTYLNTVSVVESW